MKQLPLVIDLLLDDNDLHRLENSRPGYLYTQESNSLYPKHINHLDYHNPRLAISYGKDNHEIINLDRETRQKFVIDHQNLDEFFSVATGITDHMAMIAIGDTDHTRIQVVDADQPLKAHLQTTYREVDVDFFPVPRYFTGSEQEAILVYSDNSRLHIDLSSFELGHRQAADRDQIIKAGTLLSPHLSLLGPFLLLTISPEMDETVLSEFAPLIRVALDGDWIAIDRQTVIHTGLVNTSDFDEIIEQRTRQNSKLRQLLDRLTG